MAEDDDALAVALREACEHAERAAKTDELDEIHEYGSRAKETLESLDRSAMALAIRQKIQEAIRHATNAQRAVNSEGGRLDAEKARRLVAELLGES